MVSLAKQRQTACFRPHLKSVNHRLSQSTMFRLKVVFLSCPASELAPKRQPNTRTKCQRPSVPTGRHFACSRLKCWATRCLCLNRCSKQCPPTSYHKKGNRRPSSSEQGNRRRILAVSPACRKRFSPVSRPTWRPDAQSMRTRAATPVCSAHARLAGMSSVRHGGDSIVQPTSSR